MPKNLTHIKFIERVSAIHPEYDFNDSNYIANRFKVEFKCPIHGKVSKIAQDLMKGGKCGKCFRENKKHGWDKDMFISECIKVHGDNFDYSLVNYTNQITNVNIICKIHSLFNIRPESFLKSKYGCPKCGNKAAGINNKRHLTYVNNNPIKYKEYKVKVIYHTENSYRSNIDVIDPLKIRGREYHLDHVIPISYGWKNKINPEIIGCVNNIQILPKIENLSKSDKINNLPLWYIKTLITNKQIFYEDITDRHSLFWKNIVNKFPEWFETI